MGAAGRQARLNRIGRDGRYVIVPLDHGITIGPVSGLMDVSNTIAAVATNGADAVLHHRGLMKRGRDSAPGIGRIVHLNGATDLSPDPQDKRQVCSVDSAVRLGADAVSFHINIGSRFEGRQLEALGSIVEEAHNLGVPVLAMAYPRGPTADESDPAHVAHAVRAVDELDVDLIKTAYPDGDFEPVTAGAGAPVLVAGGEPGGDRATLEAVSDAMDAGAAGVSIGRSIFQHESPGAMTAAVSSIVHQDATVSEALSLLGE